MLISAELITETTQTLTPNHNFRLELYSGNVLLPQSVGTDTYNFNCEVLPNKVLAATGRAANYTIGYGLGAIQAEGARPVAITEAELPELTIRIANNKVLDQADLKSNFTLRIHLSERVIDLFLARPDIKVYWEGRGEFFIPLGSLVA